MAKLFNLKTCEKIDGDKHITMRLKEQHEEPANVVTEKQLSDRRVDEKNVIMEKLLDAKRTGSAEVIIERNLNESKGLFAPLRDEKASAGNINKIEEKRLKGHAVESEKYEASSQIPKQKRWWENLKEVSSSNEAMIKTAELDDNEDIPLTPRKKYKVHDSDSYRFKGGTEKDLTQFKPEDAFGLATKMEDAEETAEVSNLDIPVGQEETAEEDTDENDSVWLDEVNGYKESREPIATMTFKLNFNPEKFQDLEDIRQAALEEVIKLKPGLEGKISTMDFLEPDISEETGSIILPLIGDQYFEGEELDTEAVDIGNIIIPDKLFMGRKDVDGTPMITGLVYLTAEGIELAKNEPEEFEKALSDSIMEARPDLDKSIDTLIGSFNLSKAGEGKISFMVAENLPELDDEVTNIKASINDNFKITIL